MNTNRENSGLAKLTDELLSGYSEVDELLENYARDRLDEAEQGEVEQLLAECPEARQLLSRIELQLNEPGNEPEPEPEPKPSMDGRRETQARYPVIWLQQRVTLAFVAPPGVKAVPFGPERVLDASSAAAVPGKGGGDVAVERVELDFTDPDLRVIVRPSSAYAGRYLLEVVPGKAEQVIDLFAVSPDGGEQRVETLSAANRLIDGLSGALFCLRVAGTDQHHLLELVV